MARSRVFISYHRQDAPLGAGRIYDWLRRSRFPRRRWKVFMDVKSMGPGDFRKQLDKTIRSCHALIAVVGPRWPASGGGQGAVDYVHLEIATAFESRVSVLPVCVEGAEMPRADQVPQSLKDFPYQDALPLREVGWEYDMGRLEERVQVAVREKRRQTPLWKRVIKPLAVGAVLAAVLAGVGGGVAWIVAVVRVEPSPTPTPTITTSPTPTNTSPPPPEPCSVRGTSHLLGDRVLKLCSPRLEGSDVKELQRLLNALGFDAGEEDGFFGRNTDAALRAFQDCVGVHANGRVDSTTAEKVQTATPQSVATCVFTARTWEMTSYWDAVEQIMVPAIGSGVTAVFSDDGSLSGSGGCNEYSGSYATVETSISIGQLSVTRKFCFGTGIMAQEAAFIQLLESARTYAVDGQSLTLSDEAGNRLLTFRSQMTSPSPSPSPSPFPSPSPSA